MKESELTGLKATKNTIKALARRKTRQSQQTGTVQEQDIQGKECPPQATPASQKPL
jgi:hypothetical protein